MSRIGDNLGMAYSIETTEQFDKWFSKLKDTQAKARIILRLRQVTTGHFGDHKQINESLYELRFFFGAGYRVYYTRKGSTVVLLLNGGEKDSQSRDIKKATELLKQLEG